MNTKNALIIMTKDPVLGQCKTRLAKTIGDEKALEVYIQLLDYTADFSKKVNADKFIYSTAELKDKTRWESNQTLFNLQSNGDLGNRMNTALEAVFHLGYHKAVVIGSDCAEIDENTIQKAYDELASNDVVVGPALDGGYYLIGMKKATPALFQDIEWSTENVCPSTISIAKQNQLSIALLEAKSDIDFEEDLNRKGYIQWKVKQE
ncbi:TIGR04282 family arsenosugar biosynthesis glycosyltransferase [Brumimicrobium aurantiacum]|uniref:Glycosyltransferase n=1 Tax=Brumimicrobium aurantiacum TaxID=1737063 RepID=A0A3E1F099_9FLAO|nr:TIGR04282 family arsenosugar biosynthesis glycosyltransferase [Brumimicrobium aurantiacum]RFC55234.1 glycosyltransferase [Brumimicrobium aurantiacum]